MGCCKNIANRGCGWVLTIDVYFSQFWGLEVGGFGASRVRCGCGSTSWSADGRLFIAFFPGREQRQGGNSHLPPLITALIPFMRLHSASQRPTSASVTWRSSDCIMEIWGETQTHSVHSTIQRKEILMITVGLQVCTGTARRGGAHGHL